MTALTEKRILGIRNGDAVLVPPMEWDPATGAELAHDFVEVGPGRHRRVVDLGARAVEQHPLDQPFALRLHPARRRDHAAAPRGRRRLARRDGDRPAGRAPLAGHPRAGASTTSSCFVPGEEPEVEGDDAGPADEPVTLMDYLASITYRNPVPPVADRARSPPAASNRLLGQRCPVCERVYAGGRGYCPIDAVELGHDARGRPAARPARSRTSRSSRRCSTRGRPRPSRSSGSSCCSTAST